MVAEHINAKRMTIMGVLLHWSQANSFEPVVRQTHWRPQGGAKRAFAPPSWKLGLRTKISRKFIAMTVY